jgi:EmrB/QacA subfamily drug resistance transporter
VEVLTLSTNSQIRSGSPGVVLAIILASYLMIGVDISIVNIALPSLKNGLGFSTVGLSWVVNAYMLAYGGLLFLGGRSGDIAGRRRTLFGGVALFTAASALAGFSATAWWLLAARVLQGIGAAFIAPSTLALLITNFPEGQQRNRALSIYSASVSLGIITGLMLGGLLTGWLSWRWVFFVNVPVGAALLLAIPWSLKETDRLAGRFDVAGAAASSVGTTLLVYGLIRAASTGALNAETVAAFTAAVILIGLFVWHERRTSHPLLPLHLFSSRNRVGAYMNFLFILAGNYGMFFFATQFMQGALGFSPLQTGLAYLPMAVTLLITVRIVPRMLKTMSARSLILPGTLVQALGILWLSRLSAVSDYLSGVFGPMVMIGLASGLCILPLNTIALSAVDRRESGAASGLAQTMMSVGGSFGLAILVTVFGAASRGQSAAFVPAADASLRVAAFFAAAAFLVAAFVIRAPRPLGSAASAERNKSIVHRYLEMWNTGNAAAAQEILHPQWVDHAHPEVRGIRAVGAALARTRETFPDFHIGVDSMVSEGDRVAVHSTIRRTNGGGPQVSRVMWFIRVEGGKMAEMWTATEQEHGAAENADDLVSLREAQAG